MPDLAKLQAMTGRFAPVEITADLSTLPACEQQALAKLVEAGQVIDMIFLRQVWAGNENLLLRLRQDDSALGRARLHYFLINKGPWSRLDGNSPFIPGVPWKLEGASFYPENANKAEVELWFKSLADAERAHVTGFFTTVRRAPRGGSGFAAVPYSEEYHTELAQAAQLLRDAAAITTQPTLKAFLRSRAAAFLNNDYYASDVAWMELDASIEP
ncbi:MAG: hypothetical protein ABSC02_14090, partial [Acidobacteriota bacterium]